MPRDYESIPRIMWQRYSKGYSMYILNIVCYMYIELHVVTLNIFSRKVAGTGVFVLMSLLRITTPRSSRKIVLLFVVL